MLVLTPCKRFAAAMAPLIALCGADLRASRAFADEGALATFGPALLGATVVVMGVPAMRPSPASARRIIRPQRAHSAKSPRAAARRESLAEGKAPR
jgi:hypothetical protein